MRSLKIGLSVLTLTIVRPAVTTAQSLEVLPVPCKGQIVSRIEVHTRPPFEIGGSKLQQRLARRITALHATTNPEIIRRFIALSPGEPCTELRRTESERILRAQPYLADALVLAFPEEKGTVWISVLTVDEVSVVVSAGASGQSPYLRAFRLGESNLMGEAISVYADWRYNADFRDAVSARLTDYQLLGRPYQLQLDVARRERGMEWSAEARHPFFTDLQRVSWRTTAGSQDGYSRFRLLDGTSLLLPLSRDYGDVGGVVRVGPPGSVALIGASVSYEQEMPGPEPLMLVKPGQLLPVSGTPLSQLYSTHRTARVNGLLGLRRLRFMQVAGFESLDGFQDVKKGVELSTLVGRGIQMLRARERDTFVSADLYVGFGSGRAFAAAELLGEGRRPDVSHEWDGLLASARAATYLKPFARHTLVADAEWSAGWRQRIPFQLALADRDGGPLGYSRSYLAGGRRIVTRIEDRVFLTHLKQFASLGIAPFVNTGELWSGDAPFGSNTGVKYSVGVSVLASVPPRSQRLWRLDLSFPIQPDYGAKWQLKLIGRNMSRMFWKEPGDVARNRERSKATTIFNWP